MINGTKTIVTSIYELHYDERRCQGGYKSFYLLTETIQALIFPEYEYVIYTDEFTVEKHEMRKIFNQKNVTLKIKELKSDFFKDKVEPIRDEQMSRDIIYDRIYSVRKYLEVVVGKIQNIIDESNTEGEGSVIWLDAGLFGTSCDNAWRDYMRDEVIYRKPDFLNKIFEKIEQFDFIATKGNHIALNYAVRERINEVVGGQIQTIPGCLFGGKKHTNIEVLSGYLEVFENYITKYKELISEQEVLSILTYNKNVKFFEFEDWNDLQKAFLLIMDLYDESKYRTDLCYKNLTN